MEHLWTTLFCTLHLGLGYFAGRGRSSADAGLLEAARSLQPSVARFERSYGMLQSDLDQLPAALRAAVDELRQSVSVLSSELTKDKQRASITDSATQNYVDRVAGAGHTALASRGGARAADRQSGSASTVDEQRGADRIGHNVPEFMATFEDDLRSLANFEQVQCHDLSATSVSFFLDRPLVDGDALLITLGQQSGGVIMAAKVIYSRPIIVRGIDRYRIGCKFERRLDPNEAAKFEPLLFAARSLYAITAQRI